MNERVKRAENGSEISWKSYMLWMILALTIVSIVMVPILSYAVGYTWDGVTKVWITDDFHAGEWWQHGHVPDKFRQPDPKTLTKDDVIAGISNVHLFDVKQILLRINTITDRWKVRFETDYLPGTFGTMPGGLFLKKNTSSTWDYYFDLATNKTYDISKVNDRIRYSEDVSAEITPNLENFRKGVPIELSSVEGLDRVSKDESWSIRNGSVTFEFHLLNRLLGENIHILWSMSCGNDIVFFKPNGVPVHVDPTPTPEPTATATPTPDFANTPIPYETPTPPSNPIPEPSTVVIVGTGLLGIALLITRKRRK